jgi:hypothetical protein
MRSVGSERSQIRALDLQDFRIPEDMPVKLPGFVIVRAFYPLLLTLLKIFVYECRPAFHYTNAHVAHMAE